MISFALSGSKESVVVVCCLVGNSSGILLGMGTILGVGSEHSDKMCWELTLRNGDELGIKGGAKQVHRREKSRVFQQNLLSHLGMGQRVRRGYNR